MLEFAVLLVFRLCFDDMIVCDFLSARTSYVFQLYAEKG
jgi:hypothetical protein